MVVVCGSWASRSLLEARFTDPPVSVLGKDESENAATRVALVAEKRRIANAIPLTAIGIARSERGFTATRCACPSCGRARFRWPPLHRAPFEPQRRTDAIPSRPARGCYPGHRAHQAGDHGPPAVPLSASIARGGRAGHG